MTKLETIHERLSQINTECSDEPSKVSRIAALDGMTGRGLCVVETPTGQPRKLLFIVTADLVMFRGMQLAL